MDKFHKSYSYTAEPNPAQPDKPQKFNASQLNPLGSPYAAAYGKETTRLIKN